MSTVSKVISTSIDNINKIVSISINSVNKIMGMGMVASLVYTPPVGDAVTFDFVGGYTPPAGDDVNF